MNNSPLGTKDFFKSYFFDNHYVAPVDLSDAAIKNDLLEEGDLYNKVQDLVSDADVKEVFSSPLSLQPDVIEKHCKVLKGKSFKLLSTKQNMQTGKAMEYYSVIEHDDLPGYVIKSGATRVPKDQFVMGPANDRGEMVCFTEEESLLRVAMCKRIQKVAKEAGVEVILPTKKFVAYKDVEASQKPQRKYCVLCEKLDVLSKEETIKEIQAMNDSEQKKLATDLATLVKKVGFADASLDNIRLNSERKIVILDTEPAGLVVKKKPGLKSKFFHEKGHSVEMCARVGLYILKMSTQKIEQTMFCFKINKIEQLDAFRSALEAEYDKAIHPKLSKWKITLSIASLGIYPFIIAIVSYVNKRKYDGYFKETVELTKKFIVNKHQGENLKEEEQKKYQKLLKRNCRFTEGVVLSKPLVG